MDIKPASSEGTDIKKKSPVSKKSSVLLWKRSLEQVKTWFKKYKKIIQLAKDKGLNESDTSNVINDMLCDIFWFEKMVDITTEYKIKWQFCDYGIKINNKLAFLVEIKAIWIDLNENHIYQASSYASSEWVKWVILTNLKEWRLYHLSFWTKIDNDLVFCVDLLDSQNVKKIEESLSYLHKESFVKWHIEKLWSEKSALTLSNMRKVLLSKGMIKKIQWDLTKLTKVKVSESEIHDLIDKVTKE